MISILKQKVKSADATQLVDKVFTFVLILAWTALPSLPSLGRCASPLGSNLRLDSAGQQPGDWSGSRVDCAPTDAESPAQQPSPSFMLFSS